MRNADRHGRTVQQPARMAAAHHRAPHRLHSRACVPGGRIQPVAQDRDPCREVRREDGVARARRRFAGRPHGQRDAGPGELQLRHSGVLALQRAHAGDLSGLPGDEGWLSVGQREARLGIEIDEKAAAKAPFTTNELNGGWGEIGSAMGRSSSSSRGKFNQETKAGARMGARRVLYRLYLSCSVMCVALFCLRSPVARLAGTRRDFARDACD